MPTESDFRDAGSLIRRAMTDVDAAQHHIESAQQSEPVRGGTIAAAVNTACETGLDDVAGVRARLTGLTEMCERRALVCAEHEATLQRWRAAHDHWSASTLRYRITLDDPHRLVRWPGPEPSRPRAPFDWVEPR